MFSVPKSEKLSFRKEIIKTLTYPPSEMQRLASVCLYRVLGVRYVRQGDHCDEAKEVGLEVPGDLLPGRPGDDGFG